MDNDLIFLKTFSPITREGRDKAQRDMLDKVLGDPSYSRENLKNDFDHLCKLKPRASPEAR